MSISFTNRTMSKLGPQALCITLMSEGSTHLSHWDVSRTFENTILQISMLMQPNCTYWTEAHSALGWALGGLDGRSCVCVVDLSVWLGRQRECKWNKQELDGWVGHAALQWQKLWKLNLPAGHPLLASLCIWLRHSEYQWLHTPCTPAQWPRCSQAMDSKD